MTRILIIDDKQAKILTHYIESEFANSNYKVSTALNGLEALSVLEITHPQIIILDNKMPAMNGVEFMHAFKTERYELFNDAYVIGRGSFSEKQVRELGLYGCVQKDESNSNVKLLAMIQDCDEKIFEKEAKRLINDESNLITKR